MHRIEAGVADTSGWVAAVSTDGDFSVTLPCLFNDFTTLVQDASAPVTKTDTLGCRRPNQQQFSATRISYKKDRAAEYFRNIAVGAGLDGVVDVERLTFDGYATVDISARNSSKCAFFRYVLVDDDVFALSVESPLAACDGLAVLSARLFSSLSIGASQKAAVPRQ